MTTDYPKRLMALRALTAQLETVTPANGYVNDLSPVSAEVPRVYRGRALFGDDDPLPCVSILEALHPDVQPDEADAGLRRKDKWILLVQGWALKEENEVHPTDAAHILMADVVQALGRVLHDEVPQANYMLGGAIEGMAIEPGVVRPPDETSSRSFFYLRVIVEIAERLDDPYGVIE
jgi:hypothetical protein